MSDHRTELQAVHRAARLSEHRTRQALQRLEADLAARAALDAALTAQWRDILELAERMRLAPPPPGSAPDVPPVADAGSALEQAYAALQAAADALDAAERAGHQPRFLSGLPVWLRNGLVYAGCAAAMIGLFGAFTVVANRTGGFRWDPQTFLALPCCGMPLFGFGLGFLATGRLFASRLGDAASRTPGWGLIVSFAVPWLCCGGVALAF
jgi:hypothetical protein